MGKRRAFASKLASNSDPMRRCLRTDAGQLWRLLQSADKDAKRSSKSVMVRKANYRGTAGCSTSIFGIWYLAELALNLPPPQAGAVSAMIRDGKLVIQDSRSDIDRAQLAAAVAEAAGNTGAGASPPPFAVRAPSRSYDYCHFFVCTRCVKTRTMAPLPAMPYLQRSQRALFALVKHPQRSESTLSLWH